MQKLIATLALATLFAAPVVHAQESPGANLSGDGRIENAQRIVADRHAGVAMMATGIIATVAGVALTAYGSVELVSWVGDAGGASAQQEKTAGISTLAAGQALGLIGAPLWAIGQNKVNRAKHAATIGISAGGLHGTF